MADIDLTAQRLRELFSYDQTAGVFARLKQRGPSQPGPIAPCCDSHGYQVIRVDYRLYRAHRLAWLHTHGEWPEGDIDHIDGIRTNNAISNLRDVTRSENCQNLRASQAHNRLGSLGVSKASNSKVFRARIAINGKEIYLGCFKSVDEAQAAYIEAKRELHPASTL
jgi:hypothetical protein